MKNKFILSVALMITAISCSKTPNQLFELSNENLEIDNIDQAIVNLDKIVKNYPKDSLASKAQYKIASIYLNWKNDLNNGFIQLQNTAINYNNSIQGEQAQSEIDQFPEYIINKAESLRKRKML